MDLSIVILVVFFALIAAFALVVWLRGRNRMPQEEMERLVKEGAVLVDMRKKAEYSRGYIPGASNIPMETVEEMTKAFSKKYPRKDRTYILYCQSGGRSALAMRELKKIGYTDLHNFGGITRWKGRYRRA